jgi:hypothetical protein
VTATGVRSRARLIAGWMRSRPVTTAVITRTAVVIRGGWRFGVSPASGARDLEDVAFRIDTIAAAPGADRAYRDAERDQAGTLGRNVWNKEDQLDGSVSHALHEEDCPTEPGHAIRPDSQ